MPKQLNVNLGFTADTSQAKAQLQDLQKQLTNLINNPKATSSIGLTKEIQEASVAAATLKTQLQEATNVNTGKLDLGKLSQSLKQSGYEIKDYKNALLSLGPEGQQAFATLAQSISLAEVPLRRSNALLAEFGTTLKNTARWQISSSVLHGFMGSIQSAYRYAQDLNESLNNIRIVTGQTTDQMADFAKQANASAKALSTTTTAYTDAALIFYQQGLTGDAVTERTDTVVKMANVTGQSAEEVSSYMTAIWNNFYDGSESLEHYADVITALGASTASSSEEIAEGLSKFASVADTIGLSYDYATSILSALVANTRQSADVIGTSLKTILARLQSVKLGDTLEDGVELTKYTKALNDIGVSVLDLNGNLRDADDILKDTAKRWDTLTNAQQAAVAQTVAGTRQYAQFIAMMENWDDVELNLATAQGADGSLQDQADIYAESWDAASKRVKASAQDIYDSLLNDKFFIGLNNVFAGLLDTIGGVIDGLGGMKGVLLAVGSIFLKVYRNQAAEALQNVQYSFMMMTKTGREEVQKLRAETNKELKTLFSDDASVKGNMMGEAYATQASVQEELLNKAKSMTEEQQKIAQILLDQHTTLVQNVAEQEKLVEKAEEEANLAMRKANSSAGGIKTDEGQGIKELAEMTKQANAFESAIDKAFGKFDTAKMAGGTKQAKAQIDQLKQQVKSLNAAFKEPEQIVEAFGEKGAEAFKQFEKDVEAAADDPQKLEEALNKLFAACDESKKEAQALGVELRELAGEGTDAEAGINAVEQSAASAGQELGVMASQMANVETSAAGFGDKLNQIPSATNNTLQGLVQIGQALSTVAMAVSSVSSLVETWKGVMEGSVEPLDAVKQTLTTLGFVIPMLITSFNSLNMAEYGSVVASIAAALGFTGTATAAEAAAAGTATFGTVLYTVLWPIGLVMAAIGLLIGVVWLLVKAFQAITSSPVEEKLKKAEEQAQQSAEAFDRVAESVKGVKDKLDELAESYDTIDQLKKGTDEWYEAVQNVNYEVSKLLDKYPDLANYIYNDDGLLRISQQGMDMIDQVNNERLQTANNIKLNDQRAVNEAKMDANWGDLGLNEQSIASVAQQYYNNPQGGDMVFTREAAEDITDVLFGSLEDYTAGYDDEYKHYGEETYNEMVDWVEEFINENEEVLKSNKQLADANQQIVDAQLAAKMSLLGSNRTTEQTKELLGENAYQDAFNTSKAGVEERFGDWNDHINYSEDDSEWEDIQKFMDLQGDDVEYVAQRWGKMILKIGDEEKEFTKEQVYNALAEAYSNEELETMVHQKLQENLGQVLTDVDMGSLDTDTLINLDNLHLQLEQALSNIDSDSVDAVFDKIVTSAGTSTDAIESMANKFTSIDWGDVENLRKFNAAAQELESGKMTIDEFTYAIDKMVAATELEGMDDFFKNAADSLGLKEEDAAMMKEYARNLMEFSEEAGGVSEQLATNADSAADLAVEIYRMNKGIDALADGFEDWNDIITKSNKESQEYSEAMYHMKQALSDVLDVESDLISSRFVEDHLEEIKKAAEGDADAIDALRASMDEEIIANITVGQSDDFVAKVMEAQNDLNDLIANMDIDDIEVGAIIDDADFIAAANNLVNSASMTADEANAYFAGIGYEPVYSTEDLEGANSMQVPNASTELSIDHIGWSDVPIDLPDWFPGDHSITLPQITYSAKPKSEDPVDAPADMRLTSFSGDGKPPEIKGMRKKATGSQNNYSSSNPGGKSPGSSSKKTPSKKDKKSDKKDHKDPIKDVADRYHDLNETIQDLDHQMSMLDKTQSHLFGKELINSLQKENKLLSQQRATYGEINEELKREQNELRNKLSGYGITADTDSIDNYETVYNNIRDTYNAAIAAYNETIDMYNAMSAEQQEATGKAMVEDAENVLKNAKEQYDEAMEWLKRYDETIDELQKNEEKQQELLLQQIENNLKAFEIEIELKLDIEDAKREVNDFLKEINTDFKKLYKSSEDWARNFSTAVKNAKTYTESGGTIETDLGAIQQVKDIIDNPNYDYQSEDSMFASKSEAIKKYQELQEQLMSDSKALFDLYQQAWEDYLSAIDEVADQWNDIIDDFDDINDTLDHYQKIAELLYGGEDTAAGRKYLDEIYETSANNSLAKQDTLRQEIEAWQAQLNQLQPGDEDYEKIKGYIEDANKELDAEIENYLQTIQSQLLNSIHSIMDTADKAMTGGLGTAKVLERWEDAKNAAEGYYDEVERVYELESLESKWEAAISKTSSLKAQQQLKTLMDAQLKDLQEKTKLSEYDIELAEKDLAIAQAQAQLEDAQNNKTSMKLTRGADGNWSYQYVADEDDMASKQEEVLNSLHEKYEFVKNASVEATEELLNLNATAQERLTALFEELTNADGERRAELQEEYDYLYNYYYGDDGLIVTKSKETADKQDDLNVATMETLWGLYETDEENYERMTDNEKDLIDGLKDQGINDMMELMQKVATDDGSFYSQMYDKCKTVCDDSKSEWQILADDIVKNWAKNPDSVQRTMQDVYKEVMNAVDKYDKAIVKSEDASGKKWTNIGKYVDEANEKIKKTSERVDDVIDKTQDLETFRQAVEEIGNEWENVKGAIEDAISSLEEYLNMLNDGGDGGGGGSGGGNGGSGGGGGGGGTGGGGSGGGGGGSSTPDNSDKAAGVAAAIWMDGGATSGWYCGSDRVSRLNEKGVTAAQAYINAHGPNGDIYSEWNSKRGQLKNYYYGSFDTGGYTGDWNGGDGRLAMLHSKELVLNADDTRNILTAVNTVRDIASFGDSIASNIANGLNNIISNMLGFNNKVYSGISSPSTSGEEGNTFNITAEFPNANSVAEIQEAILSLPTLASQYLNQNKR